uniref:Uncharacterized protein n=1 Tax=Pithovirus LCPAC403 TaxID=2506596 RepID=A0A481ZDJ0_9VIRU|nr:MAG: hypothetical protein LCPAC403_02430 [Pithovirus LCPAC403]
MKIDTSNHFHENSYTIDPNISMNPSIIGLFGYDTFNEIPDDSFDFIVMENQCCIPTALAFREIDRMAKSGADIKINFKFPYKNRMFVKEAINN